jgi:hypothetical protein
MVPLFQLLARLKIWEGVMELEWESDFETGVSINGQLPEFSSIID